MLDTNAFDYIYDSKLTVKVREAVDDGRVRLFASDAQSQEIERFSNSTRKRGLKQTAKKIRVTYIETSGAIAALDQECEDGFRGSRVEWAKVIDCREKKLLEKIIHMGMRRLLKNSSDVLTLFTAIKENIGCLVTNDGGFEKSLRVLKKELDTELQIISHEDFGRLL
jgi:hypothetical protein